MPLARISLREGTSEQYRRSLADGVHQAMVRTLSIPDDDRFQLVTEYPPGSMIYDARYLGVERSDRAVFIEIVVNFRSTEQKRAMFEAIAEHLARSPGMRREDVFIGVVEVDPQNWWAFARKSPDA
jgi:phenylpyruvate tautomerase PptA (4-oxalocrotonate tautomerase family)